ncbi:MAG: chemotaxis protein CheC [Promethearchaeota archaeon]|nr:MAG: chemotaxis protein CheC [Candidatus Lokiarchaeota archaeon]
MLKSESENMEFGDNLNVVIIQILDEKYLVEVEYVKEIFVPEDKIIPVPLAEKSIVGIINIRGDIYSIISLRHNIYDNDIDYGLSNRSRILLLEYKDLKIAILVDAVIGVKDIPISIFRKHGTIVKTNIDFRLIKLTGIFQDESLILLDLDALIQPYIKSLGKKMPKKVEQIPKTLEKPKVQPKQAPKTVVESTVVIPQEVQVSKDLTTIPEDDAIRQVSLTAEQQDTLKEIGNIGTGNAVTALSRLVKKKIDVTLTDVGIVPLEELPTQFGGQKEKVCGIFCHIETPTQATILNIFEMTPLMQMIADLAGKKSKIDPKKVKSKKDLDDFAISTIVEMGNIMAGHYASALADLLGLKLMIDIPEFAMSQAGEIGEFLSKELKSIAEFFIIIKTSIKVSDLQLKGMFFFIPNLESLKVIFEKLEIDHEISVKHQTVKRLPDKEKLKNIKLTEIQRDALQEVGNIGAGNAANALAQMINKRVDINIPSVEMVELDEYANTISAKNEKLLVAWSNVIGKTRATVLTLFNLKDAIDITSIIVDDPDKKQIDLRKKINMASDFPELYHSAISELGHILGSHYVSAIGDLLGLRLMTEPPDVSVDTGNQLFKILKEEIGLLKKLSLVITTNVIITDIKITGTFLFIPNIETLQELLDALLRFYS